MVLGRVGSVGLARPRCLGHAAEHGHAPIPDRVMADWTAQAMRTRRKVGKRTGNVMGNDLFESLKLIFFHRFRQNTEI